jgi:hypothetical protein
VKNVSTGAEERVLGTINFILENWSVGQGMKGKVERNNVEGWYMR